MIMEDIPKLYTALAEWLACLIFVLLLKRRWSNGVTAVLMGGSLALLSVVQYLIGIVPIYLWIPGMAVALCIMFGTILFCCELMPTDAGFCWAIAFMFAEFVASLDWQLYSFVAQQGFDHLVLQGLFLVICYGGVFFLFYRMEQKRLTIHHSLHTSKKEMFSGIVISVGAFLISNISYVSTNTPLSGRMSMEIFYIRTLVDFAGVVILVSVQDRWKELQARQEMESINALLRRQYEQYQQSRESIELINQKYHDLKHQIGIIRMETDAAKREEYLKQMESGVTGFAAGHQTGNSILDTILTAKQLYCLQHQIELKVVADGKQLAFIGVMDLCSIFGNALDNAIESVERLDAEEKRIIQLAVYTQSQFLMIRVENYFETPLQKNGELFETTKADKNYHGYGLKSIRYTAEKYGGTVSILTEDNWFTLRVLIPIPDQQA